MGLVDQVVDDLGKGVRAFAEELTASAPLAVAEAKLVLDALARDETERRAAEVEAAIGRALASEDSQEGVRAFREKRRPRFTGRY